MARSIWSLRVKTAARAISTLIRSAFAVFSLSMSAPHSAKILSSSLAAIALWQRDGSASGAVSVSVPAAYAKPGSIVPSAAAAKATRKETVSLSCIKLLNLPISVSGVWHSFAGAPHRADVALGVNLRKSRGVFDHRGLHQPRKDRVDPDMLRSELDRRGARHLVHRGLGGAVGDIRYADVTDRGDRGDIDDRAATLPDHHGNDVLHGKIGALEIDGEDAVPFGFIDLDHAAHLGNADIVVEHVDPAEGRKAGFHHRLDIAGPGNIGGKGPRLAALLCDDARRLFDCGGVAIDAKHLRSLARKGDCRRLAVAPTGADRARADHHRRLALEPVHRPLLLRFFSLRTCGAATLAPIPCLKISGACGQGRPPWHWKLRPSPRSLTAANRPARGQSYRGERHYAL